MRRRIFFVIFIGCFFLGAAFNKQLVDGELVVVEDGTDTLYAYKLMETTKDDFWRVITNYNNQQNFMPKISKSQILKVENGYTFVKMQLSVLFNDIDYILRIKENKDAYSISWTQEKGDFIKNNGSWRVENFDDTHIKVIYYLDVKYSSAIPGFIRNYLTQKSLPQVFEAIENEINKE